MCHSHWSWCDLAVRQVGANFTLQQGCDGYVMVSKTRISCSDKKPLGEYEKSAFKAQISKYFPSFINVLVYHPGWQDNLWERAPGTSLEIIQDPFRWASLREKCSLGQITLPAVNTVIFHSQSLHGQMHSSFQSNKLQYSCTLSFHCSHVTDRHFMVIGLDLVHI